MNEITHSEVAELLDRLDYRVVMQTTDGGCFAFYPKRIELPVMGFAKLYQEFDRKGILTYEYGEDGTELVQEMYPCPLYAQRLYTLYRVIFHCIAIGYNASFIKFQAQTNEWESEEVDEDAFFQAHINPYGTDVTKENQLRQLLGDCFMRGFLPMHELAAKDKGILEGYRAIRRIFMPDQLMQQIGQLQGAT